MFRTVDEDDVLAALRAERPAVPAAACLPDPELCDAIVAKGAPRARRRLPAALVAAAVVAGVVLADPVEVGREGVEPGPAPAAADIAHIASTSKAALAASGRALLDFHVGRGSVAEQRVTGTVAFSGDDLEMVLTFGPDRTGRGRGFEARNRTVDGTFYLYDAGRWVRDTAATGTRGGDMFNVDPRTLLAALDPAAGFEVVGTVAVDGVPLRYLRASRLDRLPSLNLSLGPIAPQEIEALEVWVGADDVVRRLDVGVLQRSTQFPPEAVEHERLPDGKTRIRAAAPPDPARGVTVETRSLYSVRFTELGVPVDITAPAGAVDVAGKG